MTSPVLYHRVTPSDRLAPDAFGDRQGAEVPLAEPLLVQSPVVMLASPVADVPHAHLALPPAFADWARDVEAAVLRAALANREAWFEGPAADDRTVAAAFKPLCKPGGHLKVALPAELDAFDAAGELLQPGAAALAVGDEVRCILRLDGVAIGRTEFGAMWTLVQAQTRPPPPPPPRCLLAPEDAAQATQPEPEPAPRDEFL